MIANVTPRIGVGNTLPLLLPSLPDTPSRAAPAQEWAEYSENVRIVVSNYIDYAPILVGNLDSIAYDYFARQKVHGQHLNFFIVEQLPMLPPQAFRRRIGKETSADLVKREVLHLTYTAHDMAPFARDMGYDGPPFAWDDTDRRHRRARLDALFFHLYGVNKDDAAYILDTFPIVRREDEAAFGRYVTKHLVLAYMRALDAGDTDVVIPIESASARPSPRTAPGRNKKTSRKSAKR
jgi:hypothetical protein